MTIGWLDGLGSGDLATDEAALRCAAWVL